MKSILFFILLIFGFNFLRMYYESKKDPYEIGIHWGYVIICKNDFIYKRTIYGTIQVLNYDGTPLTCGKIYIKKTQNKYLFPMACTLEKLVLAKL